MEELKGSQNTANINFYGDEHATCHNFITHLIHALNRPINMYKVYVAIKLKAS